MKNIFFSIDNGEIMLMLLNFTNNNITIKIKEW